MWNAVRFPGVVLFLSVAVTVGPVSSAAQSRDIAPQRVDAPVGARFYADSWAVIVGINDYQHLRIPKLRYAVNDARAVERALLAQGFRRERIIMLLERQATKSAIEQVLGDDLRAKVGRDDRVIVFFAGHGKTDRLRSGEEEGYLIPADGDPGKLFSTAISMTALRQISDRIPAKHLLYVVDACYSGYALYNRAISDDLLEEMVKKPAIQILTAGRQEDQAQERGGHGIFTEVLLRGLQGDAFPGKEWLALEELGVWVKQRVWAESGKKQLPQYGNLSGEGQFVFLKPGAQVAKAEPSAEPTKPTIREEVRQELGSLAVSAKIPGVEVWVGDQKIGETKAGRAFVMANLPVGNHRVKARKTGHKEWERDVQVAANATAEVVIDIEPLVPPKDIEADDGGSVAGKAVVALPPPPTYAGIVNKRLGRDSAPMVFIPEGPFLMGRAAEDPLASSVEKPLRTVTLDGFWIDQFEVTNAQYKVFRDATRHRAPRYVRDPGFNGPGQPVVGVSWEDAREYCRWAGKRLPSEAEWEKAARGTDGRLFPWGNALAAENAHVLKQRTSDVGMYPKGASPYGVMDMAGNVWEWVQDWYDPNVYRKDTTPTNPKGPAVGGEKVLRGGSWWERDPSAVRATARHHQPPDKANNNVGLRCVLPRTEARTP